MNLNISSKSSLVLMSMFALSTQFLAAQTVEIQGEAKVTEMTNDNTVDDIVIRKSDGTLGTRSAQSLPASFGDTTRSLNTDMELAKHMCDCGTDLPPFLIESLLDNGYTIDDLVKAGVTPEALEGAGIVLDGDGNQYGIVTIGGQKWLDAALITTTFNDGTAITYVEDDTEWIEIEWDTNPLPAYCHINNDVANAETYGLLYTYFVVDTMLNGNKNACPVGWNVPDESDFETLITSLDPSGDITSNVAGGPLKGMTWTAPNTGATNSTGFNANGSGFRATFADYIWENQKSNIWYFSPPGSSVNVTPVFQLEYDDDGLEKLINRPRDEGNLIRCLKDE